ncbi:hypothetical protein [Acinetobacter bohemicus]|uniref:hypothetical protein n=1 Tax=Acinetobacter bohemicus TaxID=1435036 RepID=UPI00192CE06B|nr:hypothetical protein [Acinetobacter bohemicus]CAD9194543.1 hypothetical protein QAC21B_00633 [Acinetobacter bohemicus]
MKIKFLTTAIFLIILTGCDKPSKLTESSSPTITAQFEQSDEKIGKYLDQLDDPNTPIEVRKKILCKDYPAEYKENYMPALLKLSPTEYSEAKLLKELKIALDYYKNSYEIKCSN